MIFYVFIFFILDLWEYRVKRVVMMIREKEEYDFNKVILLEMLGNVRLDELYDFIFFYINSINLLWIKRVGCYVFWYFDYEYVIKLYICIFF